MATTDPFNQVYRGQEGTGAAFLLSGNKAAEIFNSNIDQMQQQRRMEAFQRQKAAQQQRDTSAKFLSDVKVGNHWQNDNKEIQDFYNENIVGLGTKLIAEGKSPQSDPTFLANVQKATSLAEYSKKAEENFNEFNKVYRADPNKIENSDEIISYYTKPLRERVASGVIPPKPVIKYDLSDAIKESDGKVAYKKNNDGTFDTTNINRSGIIDQAIGSLDLDAAKYLIRKKGGDIGAFNQGFPVTTQDGKRLWNTQGKDFEAVVANVLDETPEFVDYLKSKGYDTKDEKATFESALDYAAKQNKAVGGYIADYTNTLSGKGNAVRNRVYTAEANRRANETASMTRERNKRLNAKDDAEANDKNYLTELKKGLMNGDGESLRRFNSFIRPAWGKAKFDNDILVVDIPIEEKDKKDNPLAGFLQNQPSTTVKEGGKSIARYKIGKNSGQAGEIMLDNILKELNLMKDNSTPTQYSTEFDDLGAGPDTFDDL